MYDPIGAFERIRELYITYLETAFRIGNPDIAAERRSLLEAPGTLCTLPLIEPIPAYESAEFRLDELLDDLRGAEVLADFSREQRRAFVELALAGLFERSQTDPARAAFRLYQHQAEMLARGVRRGAPGIVTSGTGSGKTESFLLPVFAKMAREACSWPAPEEGYLTRRWWHDGTGQPYDRYTAIPQDERPLAANPGADPFRLHRAGETRPAAVRALILYPMNALVEDQLIRLRKAIDSTEARQVMRAQFNGNQLFLGRYTGDSPITGFNVHPRLAPADDRERRAYALERLFDAMTAADKTAGGVLEQIAAGSQPPEVRYLFPTMDGGELLSRWDMQQTPPDILITNVSMLSAMLMREVDAPIFDQTAEWLRTDDEAYFFLVLDELHLQRGSSGTEVAYLLRLLLHRLGLTRDDMRHKLHVLASSASLPTEGERADESLDYLWDMFGRFGLGGESNPCRESWSDCIVPGQPRNFTPANSERLRPDALLRLLDASSGDMANIALDGRPQELEGLWRAVETELTGTSSSSLDDVVRRAIEEAGRRLGEAAWSQDDARPRATSVESMAERLFGDSNENATTAVRALCFVRGCGDRWKEWFDSGAPDAPAFRVHTFFRSLEGLFAPVAAGHNAARRPLGTLRIERTSREGGRDNARLVEALYCEACGELFVGGMRSTQGTVTELLPSEPDLTGLPEHSRTGRFEDLTHRDYALFWPTNSTPLPTPNREVGTWVEADFDPIGGLMQRRGARGASQPGWIRGYQYTRPDRREGGAQGRGNTTPGTSVPFACPACGTDYSGRRNRKFRLSPIRNFRVGFAKTTQLLAGEIFSVLGLTEERPKLVSFSDSRQDAARAALDIESRHHQDVRRHILVQVLRELSEARAGSSNEDELARVEQALDDAMAAGDRVQVRRLILRQGELEDLISAGADPGIPLQDLVPLTVEPHAPVGPLIAEFVRLGIHPTDPPGVRSFRVEGANGTNYYDWPTLFEFDEPIRWKDDASGDLPRCQSELITQAYALLGEVLFNKTYFSLEEAGIGYPVVRKGALDDQSFAGLNAALRVFADSYRLQNALWENHDPGEWDDVGGISPRSRVRRWADRVWAGQADAELASWLEGLRQAGHAGGLIDLRHLRVRLVDQDAPAWRCGACSRVHLHRGVDFCTRCGQPLPEAATETAADVRSANFLAKRVGRDDQPFRLHCEELTGQSDDPAVRQRHFRGIVLPREGSEIYAPQEEIDLLAVTTTMEVGVDIGPLRAVYQANMPPQRFNYQQRVGRAGRRGNAFSFVLTVCRSKSHDLHYFRHPESMTGDDPPPPFLTKNLDTIALRVARKAWLWSAFDQLRGEVGRGFPGDALRPPDIHGEFVPAQIYREDGWSDRLRPHLEATTEWNTELTRALVIDGPLQDRGLPLTVEGILSDIDSIGQNVLRQGLGHSLAEAGQFPMFGMPTRVRNLYTSHRWSPNRPGLRGWNTIDRDLDLAIHEFAPGATLVKDKRIHLCVGFTGDLPEFRLTRHSPDVSAFSEALVRSSFYLNCRSCGASLWYPERPADDADLECGGCRAILEPALAVECREPTAFRTDFRPAPVIEEPDSGIPQRTVHAEGGPLDLEHIEALNLSIAFLEGARTFRLNKGRLDDESNWTGFEIEKCDQDIARRTKRARLIEQFIDTRPEVRDRIVGLSATAPPEAVEGFWLSSPKTTHSLVLAPISVPDGLALGAVAGTEHRVAVRAAAISASFILINRAALELDIDPAEFDVIDPRAYAPTGGEFVPLLQFCDFLVNGAGFCQWLATEVAGRPRVASILQSIVDDAAKYPRSDFETGEHVESCDQACYRCLLRYGNQHFHGLLDWRAGLSFLEALRTIGYRAGLDGSFESPALVGWPELAQSSAEEMVRRFGGGGSQTEDFGGVVGFCLGNGAPWALIAHPLWDPDRPSGILADAINAAADASGLAPRVVNSFELSRAPVKVREEQLR